MKQVVHLIEPRDQPLVIVATFLPFASTSEDQGWELDDIAIHPLVDGDVQAPLSLHDTHLLVLTASEMALQVLAASLNE